ncbi:MAG: hypothetical protein Q4G67_05025, partial [Actinomycetia bacterium]|nr:hypothetical protein [Actinomycetes bacterium]
PTAATPEPTTATEGATAEATADAPETPADMITAFPDGTPWSEDQITELAPYALGSTLHLPTGTFGIGENRQIIGLLTLRPEGSMSNGNVLVQYLDTGTSDAHLMLIPVGTDSAPIELGTGELVVAGDGSAFALNDGATITVRDSASGVIASQALPGQTVLAVDDSSVFVHNFTDAMRAWNYRTGEITQVTALPALVSDDAATAVRHVYADEEFALEVTDLSTGQVNSLPSGADASQTVNPLRFSADGDYVYNVRGMATNDLTRVADGAWTSPVGVRPDVLSFTMTADGTGLLAVLGQPDESGALQSVLARCDVAATSCETISDPVPYEVADGVFNLGAYVVAIQH